MAETHSNLNKRIRDPRKTKVQLNIKVPWDFREFLYQQASEQGTTISKLAANTLSEKYRHDFEAYQYTMTVRGDL